MRKLHPLLIALPSLALGALLVATLTTTARGQVALPNDVRSVPPQFSRWEYKIVSSENDLNRLGAEGWEYAGESAAMSEGGSAHYITMKRRK